MHLMQASGLTTWATNPFICKTWVGQNSTQILQPLQYFSLISILGIPMERSPRNDMAYVDLFAALSLSPAMFF